MEAVTKRQTVGTVLLCIGLFAGCYSPASSQPCENGTLCENGQVCVDGVCGGALVDAPTADGAIDSCAATCVNDELRGCGQPQVCDLGCAAGPIARCNDLLPSNNVSDWNLADGTLPLMVADILRFDTNTGEITLVGSSNGPSIRKAGQGIKDGIYFGLMVAGSGPATAIFAMRDLTVPQNTEIRLVGDNPVVLLLDGNAVVDGVIDASAHLELAHLAGPGGGLAGLVVGAPGVGCGGGGFGTSEGTADGGGGGGGMRNSGGRGGDATGNSAVPNAGAAGAACISADLQPLLGGSGGGAGGGGAGLDIFGFGGSGGGALQLSVHGTLTVSSNGIIVSSGGGGGGGRLNATTNGAGGGGGSGGGLLLEATRVVIVGGIFANGGGGGGASGQVGSARTAGTVGEKGARSTLAAAGGAAPLNSSGSNGGSGGTVALPPPAPNASFNGGGGGGSAGRIVIRGGQRDLSLATLSPAATQLPAMTQ